MVTKERALGAAKHQPHLAEIFDFEPERMEALIKMALSCEGPQYRWVDYELLKTFVSRVVGKDAVHPELRTSAHYTVALAYIDWLLPESESVS